MPEDGSARYLGFTHGLDSNRTSLINYGERYWSGERISSASLQSTVNAVVSKRFAKKQQMQWTQRGASSVADLYSHARWNPAINLRALVSRANDNAGRVIQEVAA